MRPVGVPAAKNGQHENASPSGFISARSEIPTIRPLLFFTGQATVLFGPPSVPSGTCFPCTQSKALENSSPARLAEPVIQPRSLMLFAPPATPLSPGRGTIL